MKVLVAVGSKYGSSRAVAKMIATTLEGHGFDVDFQDAADVRSVMPFDAVILGSAVYGGLWRRDASALAKEHREALRLRDVWTFSVGMENVVVEGQPKDEAYSIANAIGAREHKRFAGALDPEKLSVDLVSVRHCWVSSLRRWLARARRVRIRRSTRPARPTLTALGKMGYRRAIMHEFRAVHKTAGKLASALAVPACHTSTTVQNLDNFSNSRQLPNAGREFRSQTL